MASSDVSSVTKYFATANEGFTTTLGSTIVSGATSVPLNSTVGLTNGNVFVGIIEPGATAQQVFTGTVDVGGSQITNVVWTRGTNTGHAGGVTIVDYSTGTARNMTTTGILKQHTQAGAHTGITTDTLSSTGNVTVGGTLNVTGAATLASLTGAVVKNANLSTSAGELGAAWQTWSPTLTNITKGSGTEVARYTQIGKTVRFYYSLTFAADTSIAGAASKITLPVTAASSITQYSQLGGVAMFDTSAGTSYFGPLISDSTTVGIFQAQDVHVTYSFGIDVTTSVPMTWATGDRLTVSGFYEAA